MIKKTFCKDAVLKKLGEEFKLPKELKKLVIKRSVLNTIYSIITQIGSFSLSLSTMVFSDNLSLALFFLILFLIREPIFKILETKISYDDTMFEEKAKEFLAKIKGKILYKVNDKVLVKRKDKFQKLTPTVILSTIEEYITRKYKFLVHVITFICDCIIFIVSLFFLLKIALVQTSNILLFVIILSISSILVIISQIFLSNSRNKFWKEAKEKYDAIDNAKRDVQEIEPISNKHSKFLLSNEVKAQKEITKLNKKDRLRKNIAEDIRAIVISTSLIATVFAILFSSKVITESVFLSAIAFGQAFSSVISSIGKEISKIYELINERKENKSKYESDFTSIMKVYYTELEVTEKSFNEDILVVTPFTYTYPITGFNLTQKKSLTIKRGKIILLDGDSGCGKSTYIKLISGEINKMPWKLKNIKYFNDTSRFGYCNLLDEITLGEYTEADKEKLTEILIGTKLYEKFDNIAKLKQISGRELSNGLTQRALLARALYNLEDTDLVCIDEPIGSLDEKNAKEVISFVKEYCNRDKKRFVILCTHQHKFIANLIDQRVSIKAVSPLYSQIIT